MSPRARARESDLMDPNDNHHGTANEIVAHAREQGVETLHFCKEGHFQIDGRWISFWRFDGLPYSGKAGEVLGTLHYNLQGAILKPPREFEEAGDQFLGEWSEAGTLNSLEQAFELLKAWLIDRTDVDELPKRN